MKKLIKNKFGEFGFEPSFEDGKIYFYKIINPNIADLKEGDYWEFRIITEKCQNKVDKKGQPMFLRLVELILPEIPPDNGQESLAIEKGYAYGVSKVSYKRQGGRLIRYINTFYFMDSEKPNKFPFEMKEKYRKEIEIYCKIKSLEKVEFIPSKEISGISYEVIDISLDGISVKKKIKYYDIRKEMVFDRIEGDNVIMKEVVSKQETSDNYDIEEIHFDIKKKPIHRLVEYQTYSWDWTMTESDGTPVTSMGSIAECKIETYEEWGFDYEVTNENFPKELEKIRTGFICVKDKLISFRKYFPSRNEPKVDRKTILWKKEWDGVLPKDDEEKTENLSTDKLEQKAEQTKNEVNEIFENGIYHIAGELVFQLIDNIIKIYNGDAEDYFNDENPKFEEPNIEIINFILESKKRWKRF